MDIFDSPLLLGLCVVLSAVSFVSLWVGLKTRKMGLALIGVGTGVPTLAMKSAFFWTFGILVCALGVWAHRSD